MRHTLVLVYQQVYVLDNVVGILYKTTLFALRSTFTPRDGWYFDYDMIFKKETIKGIYFVHLLLTSSQAVQVVGHEN